MADPQVEDLNQPVSADDVFARSKAINVHPVTNEAQDVQKPVSVDDVYSKFSQFRHEKEEASKPKPEKGALDRLGDNFKAGAISDENKRLAGVQFTSQSPSKERYVGPGVQGKDLYGDDKDDTYYIKDDKGNYSAADKNKHLVFRDPDNGEYGIYNRDPEKNYGPITGRMVGLGNFVQEGFNPAPTRLPSALGAATRGQEAVRAAGQVADTTGVHVPVPQNMITGSKIAPIVAHTAEAIPGGGAPFEQAAEGFRHGVESAASAATGGVAPTAEAAGQTARGAIEAYAAPKEGVLAKRVSEAYDKLDAHMPPEASRDLTNTRTVAQDLQSRYEATGQEGFSPTIKKVLGAATDPKEISYQGLKDLRSEVGEMLESGTKISETGISDKQLRALYKGMTDDMRAMVQEHGGTRGSQLWERANTYARLASERREQLGRILGANRSDEGIFGAIINKAGSANSADAKALATAKKSMPADEWNEIASAAVGRLGKVKTDTGTHFDPGRFVKDYDKLSDRGKALLFGENQRLRKALDAISDLSKFNETPKHPGPIAHLLSAGLVLGHAGGEGGVVEKVGRMLHIVGAVTGVRVLGRMLSKPATAESVAKWMQGYKLATLKPTRGNVTMFQRMSEALANDAAKEDRENIGSAASKAADLAKKLVVLVSPMGGK